jgi:GNAT superfamily N-acetyltransferase
MKRPSHLLLISSLFGIPSSRSIIGPSGTLDQEETVPLKASKLTVLPLTPDRWPDLEAIFNARGCSIARSCWCMAYRRSGAYEPPAGTTRAKANRASLRALVKSGRPPGLLAYDGTTPVGWISIGPREEFLKLERSPVMKPVDDATGIWSVICFVVPPVYRGQGVAHALLKGAIAYAREHGAKLIEAYPVDKRGRSHDDTMWFGAKSMYDRAGFNEVARRKPARPIVRRKLVASK